MFSAVSLDTFIFVPCMTCTYLWGEQWSSAKSVSSCVVSQWSADLQFWEGRFLKVLTEASMSCLLEFILYVPCSALPVAPGTQLQRTLLLLGCSPFMGPSCSDIYLAYLQVSPPHCWHCWGMQLTDWQLNILKELQYWSNICEQQKQLVLRSLGKCNNSRESARNDEQREMVFGHHLQIYSFGVFECRAFESVVRPICTTTGKNRFTIMFASQLAMLRGPRCD